jgi:hypothetical protein
MTWRGHPKIGRFHWCEEGERYSLCGEWFAHQLTHVNLYDLDETKQCLRCFWALRNREYKEKIPMIHWMAENGGDYHAFEDGGIDAMSSACAGARRSAMTMERGDAPPDERCHACVKALSERHPTTEQFATGAIRDAQEGKTRFDLLPVAALRRLADHYATGAEKYGDFNWVKGMPFRRTYASILRHIFAWVGGDVSEDHLAAVAFGALALMEFELQIKAGTLPATLDDRGTGC